MKQQIEGLITDSLIELKFSQVDFNVEHPADETHGDYATNVALILAKKENKNPQELAKRIAKNLEQKTKTFAQKVEVVKPGFINISIKPAWLVSQLTRALKEKSKFGASEELKGKNLMVEYAHPNTHKQFHIGHLRNISIGEAVSRLLEASGAKVIRTNYQGDVGLHVAKAVYGLRQITNLRRYESKSLEEKMKMIGKAYAKASAAYEEDEKAKKEIQRINKAIYEESDHEVMKLWQQTKQWSLDYFDEIYKRLGTKYDRLYFESEVHEPGKKEVLEALKKGILEESDGAVVFKGDKYGLDTRVFLTQQGLPTYEAKELGLAPLEFSEFGELDKCIHVVAPEQASFFKVTFKVEELLDPEKYKDKQYHLQYGFVDLKQGKMSSRKGVVLTGSAVIDAAKERVNRIISKSDNRLPQGDVEDIAEMVAVGAVKYALLKYSTNKNIKFDLEESVSLEGDSGPYIQYTYARCRSVLRRANDQFSNFNNPFGSTQGRQSSSNLSAEALAKVDGPSSSEHFDIENSLKIATLKIENLKLSKEEFTILRWLYRFPEVVKSAGIDYAPNQVCNFLYELAQRYNTFYNKHSILGVKAKSESSELVNQGKNSINSLNQLTQSTRAFRLALTAATAQVLKNGLYLLGIKAPERM